MADLPVTPITNYAAILGTYGDDLATQENAQTSNLSARAQLPLTQANTALTQAQAQGAGIANQRSAAQLGFLQSLMNPPVVNDQGTSANSSGTAPGPAPSGPTPDATSSPDSSGTAPAATGSATTTAPASGNGGDLAVSDAGFSAADIASGMQKNLAVRDQWTSQELQQLHLAQQAELAGLPNMTQNVVTQHNARIQTLTNASQQKASGIYDQAYAVSSAPGGLAMATLKTVHPETAEHIEKIADAKGWTPEQTDQYVRTYVDEVGNAAHRYSGRDVEVGKDGIARDKQTNQPLLNGNPAGLTPEAHADLVEKANSLTDTYRNGVLTKVPTWDAAGYKSATAYVNAAGSRPDGAAPDAPRMLTAQPPPGAAPRPVPSAAPAAPAAANTDPVLKQALADPEYKYSPPKIPAGQAMDPDSTAKIAASNDARKTLLADAQDGTSTAAQGLQYLQAARQIMQSQGNKPVTGLYGPIVNEITRTFGGVNSTNYQEVSKYLGNAALQNAKATYGQRMTQSEVGLQLNELSPSTKMTDDAINNLLDTNIKSSKYTIDSAQRTQKYLAAGGDPQKFATWNEQYYPRAKAVNIPAQPTRPGQSQSGAVRTATGPNGQKLYLRNGQWAAQ